jgi:hypothetical protein
MFNPVQALCLTRIQIESRIIVDPKRYADRHMSYARHNQEPFRDDALLEVENEDNPLLLCPAKILVHSLNDNEWYYVATDPKRLLEAEWKPNAWSGLIKDRDVSPLMDRLRDLASAHQKRRDKARDLPTEPANEDGDNYDSRRIDNFKGKGKGLTFLLHGPPGVGKTMLAECLSEDQKRPLYRVNLGMLTGLTTWEAKIEEIFRQAHFWDAILLIDEAEVVLAERTQENMKQSAWVAGT